MHEREREREREREGERQGEREREGSKEREKEREREREERERGRKRESKRKSKSEREISGPALYIHMSTLRRCILLLSPFSARLSYKSTKRAVWLPHATHVMLHVTYTCYIAY
jgi:hypothetical protein